MFVIVRNTLDCEQIANFQRYEYSESPRIPQISRTVLIVQNLYL